MKRRTVTRADIQRVVSGLRAAGIPPLRVNGRVRKPDNAVYCAFIPFSEAESVRGLLDVLPCIQLRVRVGPDGKIIGTDVAGYQAFSEMVRKAVYPIQEGRPVCDTWIAEDAAESAFLAWCERSGAVALSMEKIDDPCCAWPRSRGVGHFDAWAVVPRTPRLSSRAKGKVRRSRRDDSPAGGPRGGKERAEA